MAPFRNWQINTDDLIANCDERTRAVYISQVNATTGQLLDITSLSHFLLNTPTVLILDASHAFGVVPVQANLSDFTVSSCYKFALGVHEGIFAWNGNRYPKFNPFGVGWASANPGNTPDKFLLKEGARRTEFGNVGHLGAYLLRESLVYLSALGYSSIAKHAQNLCRKMIIGMSEIGLEVMTSSEHGAHAGNVAFAYAEPKNLVARAAEDKIYIWGDNKRVRASAHVFTTNEDVDIFLSKLPGYLK